ncbi:MAG: proteinase inhibitor, partial [Proteobacteria bacterium]|nr:proteinase inhibitor [Pseudomonadota bacterium]
APYVWTRQLSNRGVALLAGQLDATVLGAYEPKDNFGFDRSHTGAPTVDPTRMKAFFMKELQDRKVTDTEIKAMSPLGGGFVAGLRKKAGACDAGVGIDRQGLITWKGGAARYVYLLDATAETPIVPPNLDTPVGTLWRINVAADAQPISSGLAYGSVPAGASQKIPATGSAPQLLDGTSYRLHVLSDVGFVLANCYFTY